MHIKQLLEQSPMLATHSVPDWMIGCFKRRSISFTNGMTDVQTRVFWLQGRNLTIDLRLPKVEDQVKETWEACNQEQIYELLNYEGWYADTLWENDILSWSGGTSFQIHNRWPEPAILNRVGDCMMEYSPNNTYVEDWRLKSRTKGPLVSLRLIEEINLTSGECRHRDGALIINGDWAGLVLGRTDDIISDIKKGIQLQDLLSQKQYNSELFQQVFKFETSVAQGDLNNGYTIAHSTQASRLEPPLFCLDGFEIDKEKNEITHTFEYSHEDKNEIIQRRFVIDAFEPAFQYQPTTAMTKESQRWFEEEHQTLARYLEIIN